MTPQAHSRNAAQAVAASVPGRTVTNEICGSRAASDRVPDARRRTRKQKQRDSITATVVTVKRRATGAPNSPRASVDGDSTQVLVVNCLSMDCHSCTLAAPALNGSSHEMNELASYIREVLGSDLPCSAQFIDRDHRLIAPSPPRPRESRVGEVDRARLAISTVKWALS